MKLGDELGNCHEMARRTLPPRPPACLAKSLPVAMERAIASAIPLIPRYNPSRNGGAAGAGHGGRPYPTYCRHPKPPFVASIHAIPPFRY